MNLSLVITEFTGDEEAGGGNSLLEVQMMVAEEWDYEFFE